MVQLKACCKACVINLPMFQFQYGAAESKKTITYYSWWYVSIPVWCSWKDGNDDSNEDSFLFQFQYGAAERSKYLQLHRYLVSFNSSMVQLKANSFC